MGGDFELYCLKLKNPLRIPKILIPFPVGMWVQCSFPIGMKFQGIFLTGDKFSADISSGEGVPPGLWHGGVYLEIKIGKGIDLKPLKSSQVNQGSLPHDIEMYERNPKPGRFEDISAHFWQKEVMSQNQY